MISFWLILRSNNTLFQAHYSKFTLISVLLWIQIPSSSFLRREVHFIFTVRKLLVAPKCMTSSNMWAGWYELCFVVLIFVALLIRYFDYYDSFRVRHVLQPTSKWSKIFSICKGSKWYKNVQNDTKMFKIIQKCSKWFKNVLDDSKMF